MSREPDRERERESRSLSRTRKEFSLLLQSFSNGRQKKKIPNE